VGTANRFDGLNKSFDTPTLIEAWRTAPYLHDGSLTTLQAVLREGSRQDLHGRTSHLTAGQIEELAAYVSSL
jgi:cytochrome c peroxidase